MSSSAGGQPSPGAGPPTVFSQQGSLDWVSLSKTSVSFTVDILSRYMAAGVSPFTIVAGQEVARHLRFSKMGQQNMQDALQKLLSYRGLGETLWFGFGLRSLPRSLGTTDEGRSLLGLCAALGECFHEDIAASVLHNMVASFNPPDAFTPSLKEWQMVIKACSGILAVTKFPALVEGFMRLIPRRRNLLVALESYRAGIVPHTACPLPKDIAAVLIGLGNLASGKYQSITVEGGVGAAWVAAVAEWFYDLELTITDMHANIIYTTAAIPHAAPLVIRLDGQSISNQDDKALIMASKTYKLGDISDIMKVMSLKEPPLYGGRLSWSDCLREAYGMEFTQLMEVPRLTGTGFGCAARIFKALTLPEPGIDQYLARRHRNYFAESSGRGFIMSSIKQFPELRCLSEYSLVALKLSFKEAQIAYIRTLFDIRRICGCDLCARGKSSSSSTETLCLLAIFETIIIICQTLSAIVPAEGLGLRRNGLEWFYRRSHLEIQRVETRVGTPGQDPIWKTEIKRILETSSQGDVLESAMMLFAGRATSSYVVKASAVSDVGVCAFFCALQEFSIDREALGRAFIIPGQD
jgi:hypothetical protein